MAVLGLPDCTQQKAEGALTRQNTATYFQAGFLNTRRGVKTKKTTALPIFRDTAFQCGRSSKRQLLFLWFYFVRVSRHTGLLSATSHPLLRPRRGCIRLPVWGQSYNIPASGVALLNRTSRALSIASSEVPREISKEIYEPCR